MRLLITTLISTLYLLTSDPGFGQSDSTYKLDTTRSGEPMLFGQVTQDEFKLDPFDNWFGKNYDNYRVAAFESKRKLSRKINNTEITIYMGTWCGDSRREVPRMLKILDELKYDKKKLNIHALNQLKQGIDREELDKNIHRVPTMIFSRNGKEFGRIVESPLSTLERDIESLVLKDDYKPNYYGIEVLHRIVTEKGFDYLNSEQLEVLKILTPLVDNAYEMLKYGYIYQRNQEYENAISLFKLNVALFPKSDIPYQGLGILYFKQNNMNMAKIYFEKALELNPNNKYATEYLSKVGFHN